MLSLAAGLYAPRLRRARKRQRDPGSLCPRPPSGKSAPGDEPQGAQAAAGRARGYANAGKFAEAESPAAGSRRRPRTRPRSSSSSADELAGFVAIKPEEVQQRRQGLRSQSRIRGPRHRSRSAAASACWRSCTSGSDPEDTAKSGEFGKRWLEASGTRDPAMLGLVGQIRLLQRQLWRSLYLHEGGDYRRQGCRAEARGELAARSFRAPTPS
ncbi:MAG: hypothetical protein MZV49_04855 [Rhodopseudomonas palustris]|nr:hypothetical protein [Rhodopseudomonas palustris]